MGRSHASATLLVTCTWTLLALGTGPALGQCPDPISATCPDGFYMAELALSPVQPIAGQRFIVTASGTTGSTPVDLIVSQVAVDGSTIRIEAWIELGPWAMPGSWSEPFLIPALEPGSYALELRIWDPDAEEMVRNSTASVEVRAARVPALGRLGILVLLVSLTASGIFVIRRLGA